MVALGAEQVAKALSASERVAHRMGRAHAHSDPRRRPTDHRGLRAGGSLEGPRECRVFKMGIRGDYYLDASANVKGVGLERDGGGQSGL